MENPKIILTIENLARVKAEIDAYLTAKCSLCGRLLRPPYKTFAIPITAHVDGKTYHASCLKRYNHWLNDWINAWAEIGWHAKVDLIQRRVTIPTGVFFR